MLPRNERASVLPPSLASKIRRDLPDHSEKSASVERAGKGLNNANFFSIGAERKTELFNILSVIFSSLRINKTVLILTATLRLAA